MKIKKVLAIGLSAAMIMSVTPGTVTAADLDADVAVEEFSDDANEADVSDSEEPEVEENDLDQVTEVEFQDENESEENEQTGSFTAGLETASDGVEAEKCGDNLTYTISGDESTGCTLTISGTGDMYDYNTSNPPWYIKRAEITDVVIEENVTSIGNCAFYNLYKLKSVIIRSKLNKIGSTAFKKCVKLENIELPTTVTSIGFSAFYGCSSLTNFEIPDGVTTIEGYTFYDCCSLTNIEIPQSVTSIEYMTFYNCSSLTNIEMPQSLTTIENFAFYGCSSLTNIEMPQSLTTIGDSAFYGCSSLTNIEMPQSLTTIGDSAFGGCSSLTNIEIPNGITTIEDSAFGGCSSLLNIEIPNGITTIERYTFYGCSSLTNIEMPQSLTTIGDSAFYGCSSLTNIKISPDVKRVGDRAFYNCNSLKIIKYSGSKEQWEKLKLSSLDINNAKVYYNYDPNHTHSYEISITKVATCINAGEKSFVCKFCGESYTEEVPATGHAWDAGKVTKEATCEENGIKTYTCATCGSTKTEDIKALGHKEVKDATVAATCEKDGLTEGSHCSVCNKVLTEQRKVPATGHAWDAGKVTKEATCEENGIKTYTCATCGSTKTEDIKALGHKEVKDAAVATTCEKDGLTEGSHCSVCNKVLTEQKKVPATGHKFSSWKTISQATVFSPEKQSHSCSACGKSEQREVGSALQKTIRVSATSLPLKTKQKTTALRVSGLAAGDSIVSWKSNNTKVVRVSGRANGTSTIIAGSKKGKAKITITLKSGLKKVVTVTVQKTAVKTKKITGVAKNLKLKRKQKAVLRPVIAPVTSKQKITYKSSNTKVAIVNSKGQITAKKKGTAVITVKSGSKTVKCKVTVR